MYNNLSASELEFCRHCYRVGRNIHINFSDYVDIQNSNWVLPTESLKKVSNMGIYQNKFDNMYANMTPEEQAFIDKISQMFNPKKCD